MSKQRQDKLKLSKELGSLTKPHGAENLPSYGRVSKSLGSMIAYDRTPSLFDPKEIADRDSELRELQALQAQDSSLCIDRKGKPVYLNTKQTQLLCAITRYLNIEDEDIKAKIENPFKGNLPIVRTVSISEISKYINGSNRERCREQVKNDLDFISRLRQIQIIKMEKDGQEKTFRLTAPFLHLGVTIEELNAQDEEEAIDAINVHFGGAFFHNLQKSYFFVTPITFEVWRKKGNQNELFSTLLMHLLSIYWGFINSSKGAEIRARDEIRKENKDNRTQTDKEEYLRRIKEAKQEALTHSLNFSTIKAKLTRDYDSDKRYRSQFRKDLDKAMEALKEIGLITDYKQVKGAKGQEKVVIVFSETYNLSVKADRE